MPLCWLVLVAGSPLCSWLRAISPPSLLSPSLCVFLFLHLVGGQQSLDLGLTLMTQLITSQKMLHSQVLG